MPTTTASLPQVRAHGAVAVADGCCSAVTRHEWTIQLELGWAGGGGSRASQRYGDNFLHFCSETAQARTPPPKPEAWNTHPT
eukprot:4263974-Prymnesium_polylepis.1